MEAVYEDGNGFSVAVRITELGCKVRTRIEAGVEHVTLSTPVAALRLEEPVREMVLPHRRGR